MSNLIHSGSLRSVGVTACWRWSWVKPVDSLSSIQAERRLWLKVNSFVCVFKPTRLLFYRILCGLEPEAFFNPLSHHWPNTTPRHCHYSQTNSQMERKKRCKDFCWSAIIILILVFFFFKYECYQKITTCCS